MLKISFPPISFEFSTLYVSRWYFLFSTLCIGTYSSIFPRRRKINELGIRGERKERKQAWQVPIFYICQSAPEPSLLFLGTYPVFTGGKREIRNSNECKREERASTNLYGHILIFVGTYLLTIGHINRLFERRKIRNRNEQYRVDYKLSQKLIFFHLALSLSFVRRLFSIGVKSLSKQLKKNT